MEGIRQYLLSVIAAAAISGIAITLVDQKSTHGVLVRFIAGIFISITAVAPLVQLRFTDIESQLVIIQNNGSQIASDGQNSAAGSLRSIITEQTEAYILDKASALGAQIDVEIMLSDEATPVPVAVTITGSVSPYARRMLQQIISSDIGISEVDQIWM